MINKLSTDILNSIFDLLDIRGEKLEIIYEQCTESNNPDDLDSFTINDMGFKEYMYCVTKEKISKAREGPKRIE